MAGWSSGYVTEIDYTYGYYEQLNPLRVPFALLASGVVPPRIETACELGFGQGVSIALHSAASAVEWWGTDFSPSQTGLAQMLARAAGSSAKLFDESFADFCARPDLPDFDFVALHGIFSWVSDTNRSLIVDFLRRKVRPGGVVYVSYNALPGWAPFQPMRHLLVEHAALFGSAAQGVEQRLREAMAFVERLVAAEPLYAESSLAVKERLRDLSRMNSTYLVHELFGQHWTPLLFTDMKRWLDTAKLSFVTSGDYVDMVTPMLLTPAQQALVGSVPDSSFRELVTDFVINRSFRRDYWVKGPRPARSVEAFEGICRQSVVLTRPRAEINFRLEGTIREVLLQPEVYAPLLDALDQHQPVEVGALAHRLQATMPFESLSEALRVLFATGAVAVAQSSEVVGRARANAQRINQFLLDRARTDGAIRHLASPVTGGGIEIPRHQQLFLLACTRSEPQGGWAEFAWRTLAAQGERMHRDGSRIESAEENLQLLRLEAQAFAATRLPVLRALGVVPDAR